MSEKGNGFLKIFTWRFSPFRIIFKDIIFNIVLELTRVVHVLSSKQTLKDFKDHAVRSIIYSTLFTTILISILEYNYQFIVPAIDEILSFFTSIYNVF